MNQYDRTTASHAAGLERTTAQEKTTDDRVSFGAAPDARAIAVVGQAIGSQLRAVYHEPVRADVPAHLLAVLTKMDRNA